MMCNLYACESEISENKTSLGSTNKTIFGREIIKTNNETD